MKITLVRHGESTGNAGIPAHDLALLELTDRGWKQARDVAKSWAEFPTLIVTSPYLRAHQTAQPTIERFPGVPVEAWQIQEFTYLEPSRWNGTLGIERRPHIEAYWRTADPNYQDGAGAESFATLLRRSEAALAKLKDMPSDSTIIVFSHGQFIQAIRHMVMFPAWGDKQKMEYFWSFSKRSPVLNCQKIYVEFDSKNWRLSQTD
jgi:broad specificity phosphatase PhoE